MSIRTGAPAPYGPPAGVLAVINAYRDKGLISPFTPEVLRRAGINESLIPRVYKSLEGLDLIDHDGNPTERLKGLRTARTDEFQHALAEVVKSAYAEVLRFTNPATDDAKHIADAFRSYEPAGQRGRMVTLFMGLCEAAGIVPKGTLKTAPTSVGRGGANGPPKWAMDAPRRTGLSIGPSARARDDSGGGVSQALLGLIASLPSSGTSWTKHQREKFMTAFGHVLDYTIPVADDTPSSAVGSSDAE
jgi:Family of unknown function (DUF5343)